MTASPISDLNPILMASESTATLRLHSRGDRTLPMDQSFFPSYRKTTAVKGEVLTRVTIPFTKEVSRAHKLTKKAGCIFKVANIAVAVHFKYDNCNQAEKVS